MDVTLVRPVYRHASASSSASAVAAVVASAPTVRHARLADTRMVSLRLACLAMFPPVGVVLIGLSYRQSIVGAGQSYFVWFWLGMLAGYAPLVVRLSTRTVPRWERQSAVAALALFSFAPKYLRNASGPLYFDERAHWLQVNQVVDAHRLFVPNDPVPIVQYFPGLHALSGALAQTTGLSTWTVAEIVVAIVHVLAAVAVYLTAETMLPPRGAAIAAVVYMTNAEWVFFDTQFAYESLGVTLVLWTVYFAARLYAARRRSQRLRWSALLVLGGSVCVISHHLSTVALTTILTLCVASLAVAALISARTGARTAPMRARVGWLAASTLLVGALLGAYLRFVAPSTSSYLTSSAGDALGQLMNLGGGASSGSRKPFTGSQAPAFELYSALLAPVLVALGVGWHFLSSRAFTRDLRRGLALPMSLIACVYLASVPLVLTSAGSEPARRSWAFTYLGVAMVLGRLATDVLNRRRPWAGWAIAGVLIVLTVGNVAAGENIAYRFPGPYIFGSDARSVTANMLAAESWWRATRPGRSGVVADRFNGVLYQAEPGTKTATLYQGPIMDFYLNNNPPSPYMAQALAFDQYDYLVMDKNIAKDLPLLGVYFAPDEGPHGGQLVPVPRATIERWAASPYTTRVYDSDQITIYRLDPRHVAVSWR
jgi:hypothetical protein